MKDAQIKLTKEELLQMIYNAYTMDEFCTNICDVKWRKYPCVDCFYNYIIYKINNRLEE